MITGYACYLRDALGEIACYTVISPHLLASTKKHLSWYRRYRSTYRRGAGLCGKDLPNLIAPVAIVVEPLET